MWISLLLFVTLYQIKAALHLVSQELPFPLKLELWQLDALWELLLRKENAQSGITAFDSRIEKTETI